MAKISSEYRSLTVHPQCPYRAQYRCDIWLTIMNYPWSHTSAKLQVRVFFHLRRLRQLRGAVTDEVMEQLVTSLVLSRLDYCNSVLFGLPASTLAPLRRVQNVAARLVLRLDHRAHIKPALQRLHWLPEKARIQFKIATVMHAILNQGQHTSAISSNSTQKNLDVTISVPQQPTQLLSWGHGPSSGSAPSPSAVQVGLAGIRFLPTSGTFILLRLFAKL